MTCTIKEFKGRKGLEAIGAFISSLSVRLYLAVLDFTREIRSKDRKVRALYCFHPPAPQPLSL